VFRGGVDLIQLDVSVLDRKRHPVTGLNASDFTVLEDGVERPVQAFSSVQLPVRRDAAATAAPVPLDVVTNSVGEQAGRLVIILMDRSIPTGQPTMVARKIATAAVDALGPYDLAALMSTSGAAPQNLTADRARLLKAINQPRDWSTGPSKEQKDVMTIPDDPLSDGRCLCGLCVLETLTRISNAVQNATGRRKVVLFIGSSVIVQADLRPASADVGCDNLVAKAMRALRDSLAQSNLTVHSIDPSGLTTVGPQTRAGARGGLPGEDGPLVRRQKQQAEIAELLHDQGTLQVLPELTGGKAVANTNAPQEKVPEIFGESGTYYVLGFEPATAGERDSKRSIEVKVRRNDVHVVAQRQHVVRAIARPVSVPARGAGPAQPLENAVRGLLPSATRPLRLAAAAFAGSDKTLEMVIVNIDVGEFARAGETAVPLEFAVSAVDQTGRQVAFGREKSVITFTPGTSNRPAEANVQTHLNLAPGDYEVRVAVLDPATDVVASVFGMITIPAFGSALLSLSDTIVETLGGASGSASVPEATATTRREFEPGERVRVLAEVYQGTRSTRTIVPVSVHTSVLDAKGHAVRDQVLALTTKDFTNRRAAIALEVGQLTPGEYVLRIEASQARQSTHRTLRFAIQ